MVATFLFLLCRCDRVRLFEYRTLIKKISLWKVTIRIKVDLGNLEIVSIINSRQIYNCRPIRS